MEEKGVSGIDRGQLRGRGLRRQGRWCGKGLEGGAGGSLVSPWARLAWSMHEGAQEGEGPADGGASLSLQATLSAPWPLPAVLPRAPPGAPTRPNAL